MSKFGAGHFEGEDDLDYALPAQNDNDVMEEDFANDNSESTIPEAVRHFTQTYGLDHHVDVFVKAHILLQGEHSPRQIPGIYDSEVAALAFEHERRWNQPWTLYFTIVVCSIGAMEQGWAQTSMNGANLYFPQALGIGSDSPRDKFIVGLINSCIYFSVGLLGAWLSDPINNRIGRRGAVAAGNALCLVGNLASALSHTWPQLFIARIFLGLGLGINASTVAVYAAECAPAAIRGGLAVAWQMFVAFGIFLGFMANLASFSSGASAWRFQLGAAAIPTVPVLLMVYFSPESPSWYVKSKSRYRQAFQSLCKLRNTELQAARDLYSIYQQQNTKSKRDSQTKSSFIRKFSELVTIPRNRRATMASYVLMLSQQLCGINIIAFYSSTIFLQSGFSDFNALVASCVFGFINFLGAFPAVWTMDTLGRRSLVLLTLPLMALTMFAAGLSFYIPNENTAHLVFLAILIYLFCAEYSPGMGPVPVSYSAEAFPLSHREVGMSMSIATANIWAAILSLTFPRLLSGWGPRASFELYAVLNVVALVLVFLFVPETRLKTLDELDEVFSVPTMTFIRYHVTEWLPAFTRKYILRQKGVHIPPLQASDGNVIGGGGEYRELGQDEDD